MESQKHSPEKVGKGSIETKKSPNSTDGAGVVVLNRSNEIEVFETQDFSRTQHTNYISSMSIPQKSNFRKSKNPWKRFRKLNSGHKLATLEFFKKNPNYDQLDEFQKVFVEIFWTRRYCNHSMSELAEDLGWNKTEVFTFFRLLEEQGLIMPEKKFKEVNGKATKIQKRTYKPLTKKGQKLLNAIIRFAWKGTPIAKAHNPGIVVVEGIPMMENCLSPKYKKKLGIVKEKDETAKVNEFIDSESGKEIFENGNLYKFFGTLNRSLLLRSKDKKNKLGQSADCGDFSLEKVRFSFDWGIFASKPHQILAKRVSSCYDCAQKHPGEFANLRNRDLKQEFDYFKTCERRSIFEKLGFVKRYDDEMHIGIWRTLEKEPVEKIGRALKAMKKKLAKGYRLKSFTGFFTHLMKKQGVMGFGAFKAAIYRDAIDGKSTEETKTLLQGHDSSRLVEGIRELEKETGEKVCARHLERVILTRDIQVAVKAVESVRFRKNKHQIKSWVAMWEWTMKLGCVEDIHEHFYKKKGDRTPRLPLLKALI